jgi:anti-sigma B factor antagonist
MPLEIKTFRTVGGQDSGVVTIQLIGSLDTATAPELERQLVALLTGPVKNIVFDLAQLKFLSSAGIRVFSTTRKTLQACGGQTSFVNLQPQIEVVFEVIKALPGIAVFKDVAELDRYLAMLQRNHPGSR